MGSRFLDRFDALCRDGAAAIGLDDVFGRLDQGNSLKSVGRDLGYEPAEVVALLAYRALGGGTHDPGPPLTRGRPRLPENTILMEGSLAVLFPRATRPGRLALSAGLLQVFDFWEPSHAAAQEADDLGEGSVSAYWHGVAHRREPDPGNAAYWFRRVRRHPVFTPLAGAVRPLVEAPGVDPGVAARLLPGGAWDPFAFIDLCSRSRPGADALPRAVQRVEMLLLLGASVPA